MSSQEGRCLTCRGGLRCGLATLLTLSGGVCAIFLLKYNPPQPDPARREAGHGGRRPAGSTRALAASCRPDEIKVPTLILVGEFDIPDVHAHAGAINAGIANSRRDVVETAGHLVPLEQPAVTRAIVVIPSRRRRTLSETCDVCTLGR